MKQPPKVVWRGPIGALLGTDEDFARATALTEKILTGEMSPEDIRDAIVAEMVDARERGPKAGG